MAPGKARPRGGHPPRDRRDESRGDRRGLLHVGPRRARPCCTVFRPRASWSCDPMRPRSPGPWTSCAGWNGEAMQLEVIQRKENPLLKRTEVSFKAIHKAEPTPTRDALRAF